MVQAGQSVGYHQAVGEQPLASSLSDIRSTVRAFIDAVAHSSSELAAASEQFLLETVKAAEDARVRSEQAAESSAAMAGQSREAALEARTAIETLRAAAQEALEQIRSEGRVVAEQAASETLKFNELAAGHRQDLQQRLADTFARLESGTATYNEAMETAQAATSAARTVADHIEAKAGAVDAAVDAARQAADLARKAADRAQLNFDSVSLALTTAQEAAASSLQAASQAEEAGNKRDEFTSGANTLLERLETDYSLLTGLVQELHTRIHGLTGLAASDAVPTPQALESEVGTDTDTDTLMTSEVPREATAQAVQAPDAIGSRPATVMLFGRVELMLAPVHDFDRLLELDSALARISGVRNVTLADYANEEVAFRLDLEKPFSPDDFAHQIGQAAAVPAEVVEASETSLSIRIG